MANARRILLVIDDAAERSRLEQTLGAAGHAVITAATGEEALWKLDNEGCDALYAAIALRGMSGLELAGEARARRQKLPIVMLGDAKAGAADGQAMAAGAHEVLRAPWSSEAVLAAAGRVLPRAAPEAAAQVEAVEVQTAPTMSEPIMRLKNIILFLLAPFVGLVYLLSFPIVGMGMLIWTSLAWKKRKSEESGHVEAPPTTRGMLASLAMVPGALLLGVAFAIIGPLLGIGVLLWFGFQVWGRIGAKALAT